MSDDGRTGKTFFLNTPADLLEKLRWEKDALWTSAPFDLQQRAYMVMNCLITSWQMKDWVYNTLKAAGRLSDLDNYAGRHIKGLENFGVYLKNKIPWMKMAHQIATASKHLIIERHDDPHIQTVVQPIHIELRGGYQRDELFILDGAERMVAHVLICDLYDHWKKMLHDLDLIPKEEPFVPNGDTPSLPGTPRRRLKKHK